MVILVQVQAVHDGLCKAYSIDHMTSPSKRFQVDMEPRTLRSRLSPSGGSRVLVYFYVYLRTYVSNTRLSGALRKDK